MFILITGGSCAGKSTFASDLCKRILEEGLRCQILSTDLFYREPPQGQPLEEVNFDAPESMDLEEMERVTLSVLSEEKTAFTAFEFRTHRRSLDFFTKRADVVILEGIFSFYHRPLFERSALKVYIETPDSLRYKRRMDHYTGRLGQHREFVDYKYYQQAEPFYRNHISGMKESADLLVPGNGEWTADLETALERISALKIACS